MEINEDLQDAQMNEEAAAQTADAETEAPPRESAEQLQERVAALTAQADDYMQRLARSQADFDNFRKRTIREKEELGKYASSKLISELLPVIDNFGRALDTRPEGEASESFAKGVQMIYRQFESVLQAEGLTVMDTIGQPFNPEFHQAIMQVESDEHEEGVVVEEVQRGYLLKDKVLRPAMVKVSG
ncbi:nucleotide exchange factor GrpE [Saccharibacillus sp. CPCC 101409]|uniref:nucleotide exchange factor GrpE n=1 Tax=Saccharibacillus sp. CPCC 101409 TaxID=3058041 RepID=UPI00267373B4|nr:nucleotide exchange factor GrpE [Saccharibacillus sp. CPCC 101409]MDO3409147.1 nucleotide exchange factor GrpE [Saccharibacillus sp. CPCC 101409]